MIHFSIRCGIAPGNIGPTVSARHPRPGRIDAPSSNMAAAAPENYDGLPYLSSFCFRVLGWRGPQGGSGRWPCWMNDWPPLPANARMVLDVLVNQLKELDKKVDANERELAQRHKVDPRAKLLFSIPGTSQITAAALGATAPGVRPCLTLGESSASHDPDVQVELRREASARG